MYTDDDAKQRLRDNLDGLDWLLPQLDGKPPGLHPRPRTPVPPPANRPKTGATNPAEAAQVSALIAAARADGAPPKTKPDSDSAQA